MTRPDDAGAPQRRADYEAVAAAIRALGTCWVRNEPPTKEIGIELVGAAVLSLSRLATAAGVPLESELIGWPPPLLEALAEARAEIKIHVD